MLAQWRVFVYDLSSRKRLIGIINSYCRIGRFEESSPDGVSPFLSSGSRWRKVLTCEPIGESRGDNQIPRVEYAFRVGLGHRPNLRNSPPGNRHIAREAPVR